MIRSTTGATIEFTRSWMKSHNQLSTACNAFDRGSNTLFLKSVQFPVVRPFTYANAAWTSHFPTFVKNAPTATAAFQTRSAHPATVFQNSCHKLGGGAGMLQFPPFTTDVFEASLETSHENPRV